MDIGNKRDLRSDRYGAIVIYPEGARNVEAIAKHEAKKILSTTEDVPIEEIMYNPSKNIFIALFPKPEKKESP